MTPDIKTTGDWQRPPSDESTHRLEFAPASKPGVVLARSSQYPDQAIPLTRRQLEAAARDLQQGRLDTVLAVQPSRAMFARERAPPECQARVPRTPTASGSSVSERSGGGPVRFTSQLSSGFTTVSEARRTWEIMCSRSPNFWGIPSGQMTYPTPSG